MSVVIGDCRVEGCRNRGVRVVRGWCQAHYARWRKYGAPTGGGCLKGEPLAFYEGTVRSHTGDDCLIWPFARSGVGYGQMTLDGRKVNVHRQVCIDRHGEPPSARHQASHECGNGAGGCVNPGHLNWKLPADNLRDKVRHGTSNRGARQWQSRLTERDVSTVRGLLDVETNREIARRFGVSASVISHIRAGRTWSWLDGTQSEGASA